MNQLDYLKKIIEDLKTNPTDECVEWPFSCHLTLGYGRVHAPGRVQYVHRVAFEFYHNTVVSKCVLHTCDNPKCFNPNHLYEGTMKQNRNDWRTRGTSKFRLEIKTHLAIKPRKVCHPFAQVTEDDVRAFRKLYAGGYSVKELAKMYGVSYQLIYNATHGYSWYNTF